MKRSFVLMSFLMAVFAVAMTAQSFSQNQKKEDDHHHHDQSKYPEVEKFHELLRPIWHDQYPAKEWSKIRSQRDELIKRKDAIMKLKLRVEDDARTKVEELRKKFGASVDQLAKVAKSGSDEELQKAVAEMHEAFENFADSIR
jgi:hypothetical protein